MTWLKWRRLRRWLIRQRFAKVRDARHERKLCLLIGPESTGTRLFASILAEHPLVLGTPQAMGHLDILDEVWQALERGDFKKALSVLPEGKGKRVVVTRRSMPHATWFGDPAIYMDFPELKKLAKVCRQANLDLVLLITSRSPIPNLVSWKENRLSAGRSFDKAMAQYQAAYRYLFHFINKERVPFYLLSLEALLLDQERYVQSIFQLLELPSYESELELRSDVNHSRYESSGVQESKIPANGRTA